MILVTEVIQEEKKFADLVAMGINTPVLDPRFFFSAYFCTLSARGVLEYRSKYFYLRAKSPFQKIFAPQL